MYKISRLSNGMRIVKIPMLGTKAVTVMLLFPVGSRYETKNISGVSHFVEHLMFKGTQKRPTALDLSRELDAYGAEYNAFTSQEYTCYYIKIDSSKVKVAFDLLSDMVFNSKLDEKEVEKEKGVIIEELRMYEDNPTMDIETLFLRVIFDGSPLSWDIGGSQETIRNITREQLWNYYKGSYNPKNAFLAIAGNLNKEIDKHIDTFFCSIKNNKEKNWFKVENFEKMVWPNKFLPLEKRVMVKKKEIDQAHVMLGFPGFKINDKNRYIGAVLLNILGGNMSSRLFTEVREKRGLAYMIYAKSENFRDTGTVQIQSGLDPKRLGEAFSVIIEELDKIKKERVSEEELKNAKNNLIGNLALSLEDSSVQARRSLLGLVFLGKIEKYEETCQKIKEVTSLQVQTLANNLFNRKSMYVAAISPFSQKQIIDFIK